MPRFPKVYLIVLNFNSWRDTVECLESAFKIQYPNKELVLVDNNSTDDSVESLYSWIRGYKEEAYVPSEALRRFSHPPVAKPIKVHQVANPEGDDNLHSEDLANNGLVFIQAKENAGYAGGNNLGLSYALQRNDGDYFWILNNDTVIPPDSLNELVDHCENLKTKGGRPGIIGSKLMFYDTPAILQGVGARFNKLTAKTTQIGTFQEDKGQFDNDAVPIDFAIGASLFVSREMIEKVGLMAEEYFLYNEEIDWCLRAQRKGFKVGYAPKSIIYHKQGASTKNSIKSKRKNMQAMFYQFRNLILFYRKFYPALIFVPVMVVTLRIFKNALLVDKEFLSLLYPVLSLQKKYVKPIAHFQNK